LKEVFYVTAGHSAAAAAAAAAADARIHDRAAIH